jgi:hypothetical protein
MKVVNTPKENKRNNIKFVCEIRIIPTIFFQSFFSLAAEKKAAKPNNLALLDM